MKRHWIEYSDVWKGSPMSFWVHVETDGLPWNRAAAFEPPLPVPVPGRGYANFYVEFNGFTFYFASLDEMRVCIDALAKKVMPSTLRETRKRGAACGPNTHWLSRLPSRVTPWRYREKAVRYLQTAFVDFQTEISVDSGRS